MAETSKTVANKLKNTSDLVQNFLKEHRYIIVVLFSIITIYNLQYYLFYTLYIITYPINKIFYLLYLIIYNLVYFIWYLISVIAITLYSTMYFMITFLFYSLYLIIVFLLNLILNIITITISLLILIILIVFIVINSENPPKNENDKKIEQKAVKVTYNRTKKYTVILPNKIRQLWKNPSNRCTCTKLSTTKLVKIYEAGETEDEYNLIAGLLECTRRAHPFENISGYHIQTIQRINNCCLWTKYLNRTVDISKEADPNIRILFHATVSAEKVVEKGFDERFSNKDGMFGAGVYFAEHSSKSNQYAVGNSFAKPCLPHNCRSCSICIRTMFLCRVTLGNPYKMTVAEKLSHPPPGYHSVEGEPTANGLKYPEFVIYRGEQAYPEYKITYTIIN